MTYSSRTTAPASASRSAPTATARSSRRCAAGRTWPAPCETSPFGIVSPLTTREVAADHVDVGDGASCSAVRRSSIADDAGNDVALYIRHWSVEIISYPDPAVGGATTRSWLRVAVGIPCDRMVFAHPRRIHRRLTAVKSDPLVVGLLRLDLADPGVDAAAHMDRIGEARPLEDGQRLGRATTDLAVQHDLLVCRQLLEC